ncbi:hypothetical protein glysoja_028732 [Glycine soja]|uniref:Uncharacterized protein n=1 Tax=Glycine soja TaxID=3848 RepID=A0A0B2QTC2_GLYSO|nr:hypothetical protein glysoja_028732 [Glycine soja]
MRFMNDWSTSLGYGSLNGILEPQFIHNAKNRREECQHYIETWGTLATCCSMSTGHYCCLVLLFAAMNILTTTLEGKPNQAIPRWIEPKSHVQTGGYECGYCVMHWMGCIVSGDEANDIKPPHIVVFRQVILW